MKLLISLLFILLISSCDMQSTKKINELVEEKKNKIVKKITNDKEKVKIKDNSKNINDNIKYFIGEPYFIQGVEYIPEENYQYNETGLASFYNKELHNVKTANNDLNKVTELLGRHKTLPLPSTVKITNLENGLSIIIKINDRHDDNISIVQVSRKVAQLLKFYKNKIARVRVQILADPSKQMKVVTNSLSDPNFNQTIDSAPTEIVTISDLNETANISEDKDKMYEKPVELSFENITDQNLYLKINDFESYSKIQKIINALNINYNNTIEKNAGKYSIIIGPLKNEDVKNLVSSFSAKGYKKNEIIIK